MVLEVAKYSCLSVTPVVPQGSILDLLLFLLCTSDMPDVVSFCFISLCAHDAKCFFFKIRFLNDHVYIQQDIESLLKWSYIWRMDINSYTCNVLPITGSKLPL